MAQIDIKDAQVFVYDGDTPQNTLEISVGEGNLTYTENKPREYKPNRGVLDGVRDGDQVPMAVSFDIKWEYLRGSSTSGAAPTVEDALKQRGPAAGWVSSDSDVCQPFAVDIVIIYTPSCATGDTETITLPDFRYESLAQDLRAGTIACAGNRNATEATIVRAAQT